MDTSRIEIVHIQLEELTNIISNIVEAKIDSLIGKLEKEDKTNRNDDLMTREDVGQLLGLSTVTLSKYHKNNTLRGIKIDGCRRIYYKKEDIYAKLNKDSS